MDNWVMGDDRWFNLNTIREIWANEDNCVMGVLFQLNAANFMIKQFKNKEAAGIWIDNIMGDEGGKFSTQVNNG